MRRAPALAVLLVMLLLLLAVFPLVQFGRVGVPVLLLLLLLLLLLTAAVWVECCTHRC